MSELAALGFTDVKPLKPWERDPTEKDGFTDNRDITFLLGLHIQRMRTKNELVRRKAACKRCPQLGKGALCAAEIEWPTPEASLMLMNNCANAIDAGHIKPIHGIRPEPAPEID